MPPLLQARAQTNLFQNHDAKQVTGTNRRCRLGIMQQELEPLTDTLKPIYANFIFREQTEALAFAKLVVEHDWTVSVAYASECYVGKDNMTTNEAIQLARDSFRKLGYKPEDFQVDGQPANVEGPYDNQKLGHLPYCKVEWNSPEATSQKEFDQSYKIRFDIDMQSKQVVGMSLISKRFFRPDPKLDVVPELESDYRARIQSHANIPVLNLNTGKPPTIPLKKE